MENPLEFLILPFSIKVDLEDVYAQIQHQTKATTTGKSCFFFFLEVFQQITADLHVSYSARYVSVNICKIIITQKHDTW